MSNGAQRRSPLFAGLLLILLGLLFLIDRFYPHFGLGHLIRIYWPVLIILWGVAKLIDHFSAQKAGEARGPLLSGGEAALLVLLALVLATFVFRDWLRNEFPGIEIHLPAMGRSLSRTETIPAIEVPAGAHITVDTAHGDIKITGMDGNELRVSAHTSLAESESAGGKPRGVNAVIDRTSDGYRIHPLNQTSIPGGWNSLSNVDFDVQLPRTAVVTATTSRGDINAAGIAGAVDARTQLGDVRIQDAGAHVSVESQKGDVKVGGVQGNVRVHGGGGDVEVSGVKGDVEIDGTFLGDLDVRKAGGTLRIKALRTELTLAQLTGDLKLDGSDLSIRGANGSIQIATSEKNVAIEDAAGKLDIADSHGDIGVRFSAPPRAAVSITDDSGDVSVTLPAHSPFQLSAVSRSGAVESDFEDPALRGADESETERLNGTFGAPSGGPVPKVSIATSYGTIRVKKSK